MPGVRMCTGTGTRPSAIFGVFHEKAVKGEFLFTWFFYAECALIARRERIALPSELTVARGSWFDPMSLVREERDHLVSELVLPRFCRRIVITPRLASIQISFFLKVVLALV